MQIEFNNSQLIKAKPSFHEVAESLELRQKRKQEVSIVLTDAGMQIDFSKKHLGKVGFSIRRR
jgi:hypothetical protein